MVMEVAGIPSAKSSFGRICGGRSEVVRKFINCTALCETGNSNANSASRTKPNEFPAPPMSHMITAVVAQMRIPMPAKNHVSGNLRNWLWIFCQGGHLNPTLA